MTDERTCIICGGSLAGKRADAITDTAACRQKLARWRRADNREAKAACVTLETLVNALDNPYFRDNAARRIQEIWGASREAMLELQRYDHQKVLGTEGFNE